MKKIRTIITAFGLVILLGSMNSCREDFETTPSTGTLEFSRDTIFLDTVFSQTSSSTYNLKVYNRSNNLINIPSLQLDLGETSQYRLNVDGQAGKSFRNVEILPRDSIYIFIETTLDYDSLETDSITFLYTDALNFDTGINQQSIPLVTLVKDAVFLYPQRNGEGFDETINLTPNADDNELNIQGFYLEEDELTFTNEKPYVIYGYAAVPSGQTLQIDAGARLHFHDESGLYIANNASLQVNGALSQDTLALENEVIFQGDRLQSLYDDVPGQWGTIMLSSGSINNSINHATIKNASLGLYVESDDPTGQTNLSIANTQIYNSATTGIQMRNAVVRGENLVVNNSGLASMWIQGGDYIFKHATIANYWRQNSFRQAPSLQIDNALSDGTNSSALIQARFENCIIAGNGTNELQLNATEGTAFNFTFINSLIQFNRATEDSELYDFDNADFYTGTIIGGDPDFNVPEENDLRIGQESDANGTALPTSALEVPLDILGVPRSSEPDMGAYESINFPDSE